MRVFYHAEVTRIYDTFGASGRIRTYDHRVNSATLYQLSYRNKFLLRKGLEPLNAFKYIAPPQKSIGQTSI